MTKYVGALDQGTTSTRFMIFDHAGASSRSTRRSTSRSTRSRAGSSTTRSRSGPAAAKSSRAPSTRPASQASDLAAVGITNQRETAVVWDKTTGKPVYNAIVWQDTRTDDIVNELAKDGGQDRFRAKVGLPLATYFSGPKVSGSWTTSPAPARRPRPATWCSATSTPGASGT